MRKTLSCITAVVLMLSMLSYLPVSADDIGPSTVNSGYINVMTEADGTVHIEKGFSGGSDSDYTIPNNQFEGKKMSEVVIEEGITGIGAMAFASCVNLEKVTISSSVKLIDANAFRDCIKLSAVVSESKSLKVASNAFKNVDYIEFYAPREWIAANATDFYGAGYVDFYNYVPATEVVDTAMETSSMINKGDIYVIVFCLVMLGGMALAFWIRFGKHKDNE